MRCERSSSAWMALEVVRRCVRQVVEALGETSVITSGCRSRKPKASSAYRLLTTMKSKVVGARTFLYVQE